MGREVMRRDGRQAQDKGRSDLRPVHRVRAGLGQAGVPFNNRAAYFPARRSGLKG
jgi:hypothetical protein